MVLERKKIKIGTRGSPLAMVQTRTVCAALAKHVPDVETEIVVIKTSGDWQPEHGETPLSAADGGKGQFAKEIEQALLAGEIDAAVHSMKDMDSNLPEGLIIAHMLPREDVRDVLILSSEIKRLADFSQNEQGVFQALPDGCVVGTASVRRAAFLKSERPDLEIVPLRGNVQTRIDKLETKNIGCTFLALAGLNRLGLSEKADIILSPAQMLPAAGQGAVGIEVRADDCEALSIFSQISCEKTVVCVCAERALLHVLDGSCHTPIGAYAVLEDDVLHLRAHVASLDGAQHFKDEIRGAVQTPQEAADLGRMLGQRLKTQIPSEVLGHAA